MLYLLYYGSCACEVVAQFSYYLFSSLSIEYLVSGCSVFVRYPNLSEFILSTWCLLHVCRYLMHIAIFLNVALLILSLRITLLVRSVFFSVVLRNRSVFNISALVSAIHVNTSLTRGLNILSFFALCALCTPHLCGSEGLQRRVVRALAIH